MSTPFDEVITEIRRHRFHNHRLEGHSDLVSRGIYRDIIETCERLRQDADDKVVRSWLNVKAPGPRERKIDLFIGEPAEDPNLSALSKLRIGVENKSVLTAHRNRDARFDACLSGCHPRRKPV